MNKISEDSKREKLSAFLDGELSKSDQLDILGLLSKDDELKNYLQRLTFISSNLKNNYEIKTNTTDLLDKINNAIEGQPLPFKKNKYRLNKSYLFFGTALAASVAAIALTIAPFLIESKIESLTVETFVMTPKLSAPSVDVMAVALGEKKPIANDGLKKLESNRWIFLEFSDQKKSDAFGFKSDPGVKRLNVKQKN
tara:strand:- start:4812 stop:5399 length:588 start_codon:yes stop_codon:yes gene_type:complete